MDVAALNERIKFQKQTASTDAKGNHTNAWADYYSCFATIGGEGGGEQAAAGMIVEHSDVSFTVRYCTETMAVTSTGYRIVWRGDIYDIIAPDHANMKKKSLKFRCKKVLR